MSGHPARVLHPHPYLPDAQVRIHTQKCAQIRGAGALCICVGRRQRHRGGYAWAPCLDRKMTNASADRRVWCSIRTRVHARTNVYPDLDINTPRVARMHTAPAAHGGNVEEEGEEADVLAPHPYSHPRVSISASARVLKPVRTVPHQVGALPVGGRGERQGRGQRRVEGGRDEGGWARALDEGEGGEEMYTHSVSIHARALICIVIRPPSARFSFSIHLRRPAREMHLVRRDLTALPLAHEEQGNMCSFHGTRTPTGEEDGSEPKKAASARTPRARRTQKGKRAEHTELSIVCVSARRNEAGCHWPASHKSVHGYP
ncbi:hypothetical protein B0H13DRAFT_2292895 [Mycena leptocephala]|nr:hypothetical protein B0H13DRAFT_2292895 [Mycena leptocephala]